MIKQYRKKPVVIEAVEFTRHNFKEVAEFVGKSLVFTRPFDEDDFTGHALVAIPTLEGDMLATEGDFIIKGVKGECYPCKPDIFWQTYEEV